MSVRRTHGRGREALARLALVVLSLGAVLLALELTLRLLERGRGGGKEGLEALDYSECDPLLGWRKRPGARITYRRSEYRVDVAVNTQGLRDLERSYAAPVGAWRALALGDSFIEGYTVPLAETLTQRLEAALARSDCRAEVLNAGTQGYSTDQEYLFYASEGRRYAPQVVLLFFYYNDIFYNDREHYFDFAKPALRSGPTGLELRRTPVPCAVPQRPTEAAPEAPGPWRSALLEWLEQRVYAGAPRWYNRLAALGLWHPIVRRPVRMELRAYQRRPAPPIERAWGITAAILSKLARDTEADGARLLVVYVPSRMEVQDDSWEVTRLLYDLGESDWDRGQVAARLARLGREHGFPVLDLTPALRASDRGWRGRPYLRADGHWSALGHQAAAAAVRAELGRRTWLPACAPRS